MTTIIRVAGSTIDCRPLTLASNFVLHPLRLLRARRERPCSRAAEQRDELAPFQWSNCIGWLLSQDNNQNIPLLRISHRAAKSHILFDNKDGDTAVANLLQNVKQLSGDDGRKAKARLVQHQQLRP